MIKKSILPIFVLFSVLILTTNVMAISSQINTLPNSPFAYWLSVTLPEKIEMFFTFNKQEKLIKRTILAEKRLGEIQALNQINSPIPESALNNYDGELEKINEMINRGIITSEEARKVIENNLGRIKEKEKVIPIPLPIVIGKDSCGGVSEQTCQEGYTCTCSFSQDCKKDQVGQCTKRKSEDIKDKIICPMIYSPVCGKDKKTYPNECVAKQRGIAIEHTGECEEEKQKECTEVCLNAFSNNEGWYNSCSRKLIRLAKCKESPPENPVPTPTPVNPIPENCNNNVECQNKYRSCYFQCLGNVCVEIDTYAKLSDYPDCEPNIKPAPIEPVPLPGPISEPVPECSNDKYCIDKLRNCNAICIKGYCTIVNSNKAIGIYPNCGSYGIL